MNEIKQILIETLNEWGKHRTPNLSEEYMDKKQVMEYLHISNTTIWRYEKAGLLIPKKILKKALYEKKQVDSVLNGIC